MTTLFLQRNKPVLNHKPCKGIPGNVVASFPYRWNLSNELIPGDKQLRFFEDIAVEKKRNQ